MVDCAGGNGIRDADPLYRCYERAHIRDVIGVLREPPPVAGAGLGADQRVGAPLALGLVDQVEAVAFDDLVDVAAQFRAYRQPQHLFPRAP